MTTRLDRLVLLLDTGSTSAVRRTAAEQLGDIQKQHPGELYNLLSRVVVHLRSRAWDTRWAAGYALECIAQNVPEWTPQETISESDASIQDDHKLSFAQFDLASVLHHGKLLLGSAGKEYDIDLSDMTPEERLAMQRRNLRERLGLGSQFMDVDLLDDNDLDTKKKVKADTPPATPSSSNIPAPTQAVQEINMAGLSARERNMLKRKMKQDAKMNKNKDKVRVLELKGKTETKPIKIEKEPEEFSVTEQPQSNKIVVESKKDTSETFEEDAIDWPFKMICEHLCMDLFDPNWVVRHGAGIGLRSILKVHGTGAGKTVGFSKTENEKQHDVWLEDVAIRLLCVFTLDRFADFVSDQVVCPVRETCSQTLGVVLQFMQRQGVAQVHDMLMKLITQNDAAFGSRSIWEVRHAALLGLKYMVAVRKDLVDMLMEGTTTAVLLGLQDLDDDVRTVSASTILPVTAEFVQLSTKERIQQLMVTLWDCLIDLKDDLTTSTGAVMDLIAKLFEQPGVMDIVRSAGSLADLVPRLYPFFRHTITTVRMAVLNTLMTFLQCSTAPEWVDERVYRLVFQNLLVEERPDLIQRSLQVWTALTIGGETDQAIVLNGSQNYLGAWFELAMTPIGQPLDAPTHFYKPPGVFGFDRQVNSSKKANKPVAQKGSGNSDIRLPEKNGADKTDDIAHNLDAGMIAQDLSLVTPEQIMRGRVACGRALGMIMSCWPDDSMELSYQEVLLSLSTSQWAIKRQLGALVMDEWAKAVLRTRHGLTDITGPLPPQAILASSHNFPRILSEAMTKNLTEHANRSPDEAAFYFEFVQLLRRIRGECLALLNGFSEAGVPNIPSLPAHVIGDAPPDYSGDLFTIDTASWLVSDAYEPLLGHIPANLAKKARATLQQSLDERHRRVVASIGYYGDLKEKAELHVYAATAGAVVSLGTLPKTLSPLVRSVMNSLKFEENTELQQRSASTLVDLIALCSDMPKNPIDKIIKNLGIFLCRDPLTTPILENDTNTEGIETIAQSLKTTKEANAQQEQQSLEAKWMKRGAEFSFAAICQRFGPRVFDMVPCLWDSLTGALTHVFVSGEHDIALANKAMAADLKTGQLVIDAISLFTTVTPVLSREVWPRVELLIPLIGKALVSCYTMIRLVSARCLAVVADVMTEATMPFIVDQLLPLLGDTASVTNRQGIAELAYHLVQRLDTKILPYTIFLIVPILGRMSDADEAVRLICTNCFAMLIKLVPLEAGIPDPPGMSQALLSQRDEERKFLAQLLDSSKVESFTIPVKINAELRKYQQDGVNWLAFLNRFQLHGILCDDMGLGKTLQSICILASDHHLRHKRYEATQAPDAIACPSLVVCPPTLTGHWFHEIKQYANNLKPLMYTGGPNERKRLRASLQQADVVIMSYDIIRNDIDVLQPIFWNYCILDEGHIIKNGKTKITKAIKNLQSNHRLILSGTPIQNNVLELWSLFDFLMPGFLGSEKTFNERFSKPILASRDSKSSSKEQEAGALALEALHKQVLPFLLRRLKEDVLHDLPPKIIQDYYCELSDLQKSLYDEFSQSQAKGQVDRTFGSSGPSSATHIFQALQYLRKLCNHPLLVVNPSHPSYPKVQSQLQRTNRSLHDIQNAPKLLALKQLLGECGIGVTPSEAESDPSGVIAGGAVSQHRALIFCQLKTMLDIIENDLFKKLMPSVTYLRLDGSVDHTKRHDMVTKFNADPSIDVLLLTTHVGGLGLNLTGADTVIFVEHDWNPMKDLQAMDRAHRIGQKKVVNKFKLNIANTIVNQQNAGLKSMGTDQILDLFNVDDADQKKKKKKAAQGPDEVEATAGMGAAKAVLEDLESLWDEKDYNEEYNLDNFISSLQ
ncbi:hypothetical protein DM01DRAFT_355501 [Hesseltinella vesiculosa]|uniref:Uncharacterized protein n=1 Tax=Hesseltinella vesiculosa TaxID=101127 RepID=A0A1X2GAN0_9FUNG|nr:hypothetical protein DM01DRAFT_355501 [Hesseltinella vesiculosa]